MRDFIHKFNNSPKKLLQLQRDVQQHPSYSPDLAPSGYYLLFPFLQQISDGKTFTLNNDVILESFSKKNEIAF